MIWSWGVQMCGSQRYNMTCGCCISTIVLPAVFVWNRNPNKTGILSVCHLSVCFLESAASLFSFKILKLCLGNVKQVERPENMFLEHNYKFRSYLWKISLSNRKTKHFEPEICVRAKTKTWPLAFIRQLNFNFRNAAHMIF